jgi:WD40 repeat protein
MSGKIFLSYRREDEAWCAHALFNQLEGSFPLEQLFMDVEGGIQAGEDFVRVLEEQVKACDVMLVLIGPRWLTVTDDMGRRRLDNPEDFVRIEVESALRLGQRVIPVLVQKAEMPRADALPEPLKPLARRNAVWLTRERFKADAQGLIKALEGVLGRAEKKRGLSPEDITKAEELVNWEFIKASESSQEFRDHLARFPKGVTERMARTKLEALTWAELPQPVDVQSLRGFLDEFPSGAHAEQAKQKLPELERRARGELPIRTFTGHSAWIYSVAFAPDGRTALSGSEDGTLKLWDVATGQATRTFGEHSNAVHSVAFAPDGRTALSGSHDKILSGPGSLRHTLRGARQPTRETLKLWDVATGQATRTFAEHSNSVYSVAFAPDGRTALSGSRDMTLKLWDVATGRAIRTFAGHSNFVRAVAFAPDGRTALSGSHDNTPKLWDVATGQAIRTFAGHSDWVVSVAFAPDGRTTLSGGHDKTLKLWGLIGLKSVP